MDKEMAVCEAAYFELEDAINGYQQYRDNHYIRALNLAKYIEARDIYGKLRMSLLTILKTYVRDYIRAENKVIKYTEKREILQDITAIIDNPPPDIIYLSIDALETIYEFLCFDFIDIDTIFLQSMIVSFICIERSDKYDENDDGWVGEYNKILEEAAVEVEKYSKMLSVFNFDMFEHSQYLSNKFNGCTLKP